MLPPAPVATTTPGAPVNSPGRPPNPRRGRGMVISGSILLSLAVLVGGTITGLSVWQLVRAGLAMRDRQTASVPGTTTLHLDKGSQFIWIDAPDPSRISKRDVRITITNVQSKQKVAVWLTNRNPTSTVDGHRLKLFGRATIPEAGDYQVRTGTDGEPVDLAFAPLDPTSEVLALGGLVVGLILGATVGITGLVLLIIGLVQRSRTKRWLQAY